MTIHHSFKEWKENIAKNTSRHMGCVTSKRHWSDLGSQPRRALAREDLPAPVAPTITILGLGSSGTRGLWPSAEENRAKSGKLVLPIMMRGAVWLFTTWCLAHLLKFSFNPILTLMHIMFNHTRRLDTSLNYERYHKMSLRKYWIYIPLWLCRELIKNTTFKGGMRVIVKIHINILSHDINIF